MAARDGEPVALTVNGERWSLRSTLTDCGPESRVFTVRVSDEGGTIVSFGDGVHGKPLPSGGRLSLTIPPGTPLPVSLERTQSEPAPDQALWTVIRDRPEGTELEVYTPCEVLGGDDEPGEGPARATARWRLAALILAALLLALVLWR
ncbi:MAG TPA: hypothetical protein VHO73_01370 [Methylomirabilota bacterium]|jgi:hypothetical protein|nr:hypothetical protein [Methylomirabilota bacterium]